jgi:predicted acetylornithine/succinylornithine family transaminase
VSGGAAFDAAVALDTAHVMGTYARKPVMFVHGHGMRLFDDAGREYLDFVSGIGAVNLGHAHPAVADAVCEQMRMLVHVSNLYYVEHRAELAEEIGRLAGFDARVFFANSGAEANEGAFKLARKWAGQHKPGANRIITAERSFHGRTLATLAATGQASKQEAFRPLPEGFAHVPLNDIAALEAAVDGSVCAVCLEPVQGEGGVWPCSPEYLAAARRICDERGALLILDEVQTGFFRTGPAFAFQGYGVAPDVMTLAKSLANGLPIGAVVAKADVAVAFEPGDHGSTFGGGPVICAAALATISALEAEGLGIRAEETGAHLVAGLTALAESTGMITDIRGGGLMVGISLAKPIAAEVAIAALECGLVLNNIGTDIIRFLPPLVCGNGEVDTLLTALPNILTRAAS